MGQNIRIYEAAASVATQRRGLFVRIPERLQLDKGGFPERELVIRYPTGWNALNDVTKCAILNVVHVSSS